MKMKKNIKRTSELFNFIKKGSCCFTCVDYIKNILIDKGYEELSEKNNWNIECGKYFVIRNDASIIAFEIPKKYDNRFYIVTTHCDTPSLLLKPEGINYNNSYLKHNVMIYGGLLNYGWLDVPFSLAGRIIYKKGESLKSKIVDFKDSLLTIPSVAIHQNDKANSNLDINMQQDLQPILSIDNDVKLWENLLKKEAGNNEVIDYDLYAYNCYEPMMIGLNKNLMLSPRIDNLTSVYAGLYSFIDSKSDYIKVFCSFNNEEIGSLTEEGADSNFLIDVLKRIAASINLDIQESLSKSFLISSDNTHAQHPNHPEYGDDTGKVYLGKGVTIIREIESTTNGLSLSVIKNICDNNHIKYQVSTTKNDLSSGSTLSGISLRHLSVLSVDVGISELAMHSSIELCSIDDVFELYKLLLCFYQSHIEIKDEEITIESKMVC